MLRIIFLIALSGMLSGCAYFYAKPPTTVVPYGSGDTAEYTIGPNDELEVFVWRNPDLTVNVPVRPDGRISVPLLGDVVAGGRTPAQLSVKIASDLSQYIQEPQVTVIVRSAAGRTDNTIRVLGEAQQPRVVPYYVGITLVDVMADVGGLTDFADGNRSYLIRNVNGKRKKFHLRVASLVKSGDMSANVELAPNDTIIIPQRWY